MYREHLVDVGERVRERRKGLKDGDVTWLETRQGRKEKVVLKTVEGQHPKTVTIAGQARLWARGSPSPAARAATSTGCLSPASNITTPLSSAWKQPCR
ncbi:MAG: hypothetical protein H5U00_12385 [Clostridia bacterium]|nr:hypothetical protein [Clostridia bacterium]